MALLAAERQVSSMPSHMYPETDRLHEGLATLVANKRLFTTMAASMIAQLGCRLIGLGTKRALEWTLCLVAELVFAELATVGEILSAAGAGEFASQAIAGACCVRLQVAQHSWHTGEGLAACQAFVAPTRLDIAGFFLLFFLQLNLHTYLFFLCLSHL